MEKWLFFRAAMAGLGSKGLKLVLMIFNAFGHLTFSIII